MENRSVLVIDDSLTIQRVVRHCLERLEFDVTCRSDGESGISAALENPPLLILLDFMMPSMNGYQVLKRMVQHEKLRGVPVVLMSSKGEFVGEKLVGNMGVVDYITKPFSPEALQAVVQHAIEKASRPAGGDEPLVPVGERAPEDPSTTHSLDDMRGKLAMRGELGMVPLSEVFQLLKFRGGSGILHLARGQAHIEVYLDGGKIVFSRAANVDEEFLLGRFLVEVGAISGTDLELFLKNRSGGKLLGQQLLKLGYIAEEQLARALSAQSAALVYEALRWGEGEFAFYSTDKLPEQVKSSGVELNIDEVLLEGFRRVDEWGLIEKEIRDFDMILAPARDSTGILRRVELEPEEKRILQLVDGRRRVRDIIRASRRSSFDVCKTLYRLLASHLVRVRTEGGRAETA
ncbi:MAG: response regulator [Deltaproteobacteria bacterium]|nr:MAG: response regulator [Deltaproteobacteria bacterium]